MNVPLLGVVSKEMDLKLNDAGLIAGQGRCGSNLQWCIQAERSPTMKLEDMVKHARTWVM